MIFDTAAQKAFILRAVMAAPIQTTIGQLLQTAAEAQPHLAALHQAIVAETPTQPAPSPEPPPAPQAGGRVAKARAAAKKD
ncbi:MAG: hypothetical protein ACK4Z5_05445 [Brevundimonas sp.]